MTDFTEIVAHGDVDNLEMAQVLDVRLILAEIILACLRFDLGFNRLFDHGVIAGEIFWNACDPNRVVAWGNQQFIAELVQRALVRAQVLQDANNRKHCEQIHHVLRENEIRVGSLVRERHQCRPGEFTNVFDVVSAGLGERADACRVFAVGSDEGVRENVEGATRHEDH